MQDEYLGFMIRRLRKARGWTLQDLIAKLHASITIAYVSRIECGDFLPSAEFVCKIARVFDLDKDQLLRQLHREKIEIYKCRLESKTKRTIEDINE